MIAERPGLQRLSVAMGDGSAARAYALTQLTGGCAPGDEVILNTTAVELDLGTGGWHFVHWNLSRDELVSPGPDHIMKIRYTSLQADVGTDELSDSRCDDPIDGVPVVACFVHSQVAAVAAAFRLHRPEGRLAYVMTDGASLPIAMSDLVHDMKTKGLLCGTVTTGHAFGGDLEAVTVPSALGLAVHALGAEAVVVGMGPGVVGTGTRLGTTALEVAPILDAAESAGGIPIMCVRASSGDPRGRHHGISHHSVTVATMTHARPFVADTPETATLLPGVRPIAVTPPDPVETLGHFDLRVTTMGRTVHEDLAFFEAACAAGALAGRIAEIPETGAAPRYSELSRWASSVGTMSTEERSSGEVPSR
ncbi:MAG: DUF3866 family protein [Microthrixaceae bacterium]